MASFNTYRGKSEYYSEVLRTCKFNPLHKVRDVRYLKHLEKCPNNPKNKKISTIPEEKEIRETVPELIPDPSTANGSIESVIEN